MKRVRCSEQTKLLLDRLNSEHVPLVAGLKLYCCSRCLSSVKYKMTGTTWYKTSWSLPWLREVHRPLFLRRKRNLTFAETWGGENFTGRGNKQNAYFMCSGRRLPLWRAPRECTIVHRRTIMVFNKRKNAAAKVTIAYTRVPISRALQ